MEVPDDAIKGVKQSKAEAINKALELTQHRWFHWKLMSIGFFAFLASGLEFTLHAYILPFAECDLKMDSAKMGILNALFLAGGMVSAVFWGILADAFGRKKILVIATIADGLCTVLASWSDSFTMFAVVRTLCGFLSGAGSTISWTYFGEFCSDKKRPRNLCILGLASTTAWILIPVMTVIIIPMGWTLPTAFVTYKPWRLFVALVGIPNVLAALLIWFFVPETPKFLLSQGQELEALEVLQNMYSLNTGKPANMYPVSRLTTDDLEVANDTTTPATKASLSTQKARFVKMATDMFSQMKQLVVPPLLWNTIRSGSVHWAAMYGYHGLGLWIPKLFSLFDDFPDESASMCELTEFKVNGTNSQYLKGDNLGDCEDGTVSLELFKNTFILGGACFIGNLFAIYLAEKLPARYLTATFLEVGAVCVLTIYFVRSHVAVVVMASIFLGCVDSVFSVHSICAHNLFPTALRGIGLSLSSLMGRLAGVVSSIIIGELLESQCEIPIFLAFAFLIVGGIIAATLPKSSQKALE